MPQTVASACRSGPSRPLIPFAAAVARDSGDKVRVEGGGKDRVARPRATDHQLVVVGQGVCDLPRVERRLCGARVRASRRGRQRPACSGGSTADWGRTGVERT
eukprot:scaffold83668_cov57-Phaeocystis_antarctica.AAC.2